MISLRRTHAPASLLALIFAVCGLLLALTGAAFAAPSTPEEEAPLPQLVFEPGSYDFGLQQANSNSQATLQLRNDGEVPAPIYSLELNGGSGAFWMGTSDCYGRTLSPGEGCYAQVNFGPYDAAPFGAQLRVSSESGTAFTADLSGEGGRARLTPAIDPTNFGSVPVGSAGVTKTIDVTNRGNISGGAFIAVIAGGAVGSFHLLDENCTGIPLTPGATCNLVVNFQPLSSGAKAAHLGLFGDSDGGVQIILTGVGLEPDPFAGEAESAGPASLTAKPRQKRRARRRPQHGRVVRRHRRIDLAARRETR
jgi:hypothetical protein